jgi:hypothetical protein
MLYFFLHFAITAWPFLNFYGSETNHKLVSLPSFSILFLIFWGVGLSLCEVIRKIFNLPRERILMPYTVFVIWFFSYISFYDFLNKYLNLGLSYVSLYYLFILFGVGIAFFIFSRSLAFRKAIQIFIVIVFSFSAVENLFLFLNERKTFVPKTKNALLSFNFKNKPNIYFVLLDTYSSSHVYKLNLKYDNSRFLDFFKKRGFIIAENAYSNYPNTSLSLSGTFTMNYLEKADINTNDVLSPDKLAFSILRDNNYKFVVIPCTYDFLRGTSVADITIRPSSTNLLFPLSNINFLCTSILVLFKQLISPIFYFGKEEILKIFDLKMNESKFVFIHYLQLHDLIYDKNCKTKMNPLHVWPTLSEFHTNISCMNATAEEAINEIMAHDPQGIIIVQGDHGRPIQGWPRQNDTLEPVRDFTNRFSIFSAVYIPGLDKNSPIAQYLAHSPSPVNNFRLIFSYLAKTPLNLLPSRHFDAELRELTHLRSPNEGGVKKSSNAL